MTYELLTDRDITGPGVVLVYLNDITGGVFIPSLLFGIFLIVTIGLCIAQLKRNGDMDLSLSLVTGAFIVDILTVLFNLIPGLVSKTTNEVVIGITLLLGLFFFLSRK